MTRLNHSDPGPGTHSWPCCIHLAGVDGTGKSTQAQALMGVLEDQGIPARQVWLRFPRLITVPFLVYARLRGYSHREVVDGVEHGYWNFRPSWLMSTVFPWALLLDTALLALVKVYLPLWRGSVIVCDRFVVDILADLMAGLDNSRFDRGLPGRLFLALLPRDSQMFVLDLDTETARQRSPDLRGDRSHARRRRVYLEIAGRHALPVVSTATRVEDVTRHLLEQLDGTEPDGQIRAGEAAQEEAMARDDRIVGRHRPVDIDRGDMKSKKKDKVYAKVQNPLLRAAVRQPAGALLAHWLVQGLLYMDPTERWFKVGLNVALTLIIGGILALRLPVLPALIVGGVIAHTLNFLFNGQVYAVLKHFGRVQHSREEFEREVERLRQRIAEEPSIVFAAAYGSVARGEWSPTSDLDLRLVRAAGFRAGWRACWFAVQERARAFWIRFPLDLLVLDTELSLRRMAEHAHPVVLAGGETGVS